MMKEFNGKKDSYENDDLQLAIENNAINEDIDNITHIVAEVCGENEEYDWYWIVKLKNGKFKLIWGGCDCTGWDCQSWLYESEPCNSAKECALKSPESEQYTGRKIQLNLLRQLSGEQPLFSYEL